jgi:glycopeptide antibiotics resistance protein
MRKQYPEKKWLKIMYSIAGILYTACLVYIFFFARRRWRPVPKRNFNMVPFRDKFYYLQTYAIHKQAENVEFFKDFIGNILLFVPFPFLLFYVLDIKSYRRVFWFSVAASLCVELLQYIFNIGVADIDDLALNTLGISIGWVILYRLSRVPSLKPIPPIKELRVVK